MTTLQVTREVSVGSLEALPVGEGRAFCLDGAVVAVFRQRNGMVYAVQNECPHQGAPLADGITGGCEVICPYHSRKFNLATGECVTNPEHSLRAYPVRVEAGEVLVTL